MHAAGSILRRVAVVSTIAFAAMLFPAFVAGGVAGDTTAPVLTLPADITVTAYFPGGTNVYYEVSAWDEGDAMYVPVSCTPPDYWFEVGTTTVDCTASDTSGNVATGSFIVTVLPADVTPPQLILPASQTFEPQSADGRYYWYSAWANDNWDGAIPATCSRPGGMWPIGTTLVECSATDSWGNVAHGSFTVTVLEPIHAIVTITAGTVNPVTGVATIDGTVECTRGGVAPTTPFNVRVFGGVTERLGRALLSANFNTPYPETIACSSPATPWRYTASPSSGLLVPGDVDVRGGAMSASSDFVYIVNPLATASIKLKTSH